MRPRACALATSSSVPWAPPPDWNWRSKSGVRTAPGHSALTRMPWRARSSAMALVRFTTPPLDAQYAA